MNKYVEIIEKQASSKYMDLRKRRIANEIGARPEQLDDGDVPRYDKVVNKRMAENYAGGTAAIGGAGATAKLVNDGYRNGDLTGRVSLYHATDKGAVDSIKKDGLLARYGDKKDSFTKAQLKLDPSETQFNNKVYLGRKKGPAKSVGMVRRLNGHMPNGTGIIKAEIGLDDFKKMDIVDNPELRGAKNWKQFKQVHGERYGKGIFGAGMSDDQAKAAFKALGKDTVVINGDLASKYIKGGTGYKKLGLKEVMNHAKKNPRLLAKRVGMIAPAAGVAGIGAATYIKNKRRGITLDDIKE